jgi:general secretion pathway protein D
MKKPFIAILLAGVMVNLAEGPWAWAQTQPAAPAPDARPAQPPALQAPPAGAQPNTPGATPPANAPTPPANAPTTPSARPGDLIRPSVRRTGRTARPPAAARPVPSPPGAPAPAAPAPGSSGSAPPFQAPGSTTGSTSPSTPNVNMPSANSEGVMELPGEKEFNQCKKVPPNKRILKFSFKPETEITDLIGWISAISCTQFLIGGTPVAGKKVTVISPQLITLEEAYRLFFGALESVQLTIEPMGKFLRIVDTSRARFSNLPFQKDGSQPAAAGDKRYVTRLFRFDHLDPNEVMNLYNQVRGEQGVAVAFQGSLIITDQAVMLDRFGEIINELDQPSVIKEKIWMVRVRNTSATEMASRLAEIFAVQQMGMGGRRPGAPGAPVAPVPAPAVAGRPVAAVKRADLASQLSITKLIPDERSNQLIVVANEQAYEWLLTIMKKLDVPIEGGGDGRFHIYYCEHANCDELAATLSAVTGVSVIGGVGTRRTARTSVPGQAPPPAPTPVPTAPGQQTGTPLFEGDVRVTFDAATNSLVVYSSLKDFQSLRRVIEKLDGPRKQVYVEAMILEVLLDKRREVGVAYHGGLPTKIAGEDSVVLGGFDAGKTLSPANLATDLVGLAGAVFGPALSTATSRLFGTQVDIPSFGAFVKMLQTNNDVNVLSTPHLLITNNQEGEISVGQRLPFPGGFLGGFGGGGLPGQQPGLGGLGGLLGGTAVNREDVSLRMKLIPSVNEYNMIRLDVDVEISDLASPNFNGLGPATTKRTAKTPVVCKDQQTVIIGGLMSDRQSDTVKKVPVLGDIPVLGFFFRNTDKQTVKSNIIIALTPYVISDMEDLRRVAEKKMRERREFIERFSAVEDKAHFDAAIDYRRKRGMLEEINRASREIDDEEAALRIIRERELQDESTPIEPPGQGRPRAGQPGATGQQAPAPAPTTPPPAEPNKPEPEKREVGQSPAPETPGLPSTPVTKPVAVKREQ